jgi:hypothetical protein
MVQTSLPIQRWEQPYLSRVRRVGPPVSESGRIAGSIPGSSLVEWGSEHACAPSLRPPGTGAQLVGMTKVGLAHGCLRTPGAGRLLDCVPSASSSG